MEYRFHCQGNEYAVKLEPAEGGMLARVDGREIRLRRISSAMGELVIEIAGHLERIQFARDGATLLLALAGDSYHLDRVDTLRLARSHQHHEQGLEAPMPGLVRAVGVAAGDLVERGQTLVVLEAMKMEIRIAAPEPSRVVKVHCVVGNQVERGQVLVDLDSAGESTT